MQFLYPTKHQFPFDEVCGLIVRALEARAWKAEGFVVDFRVYGSGAQKVRYVSSVQSDQSAIDLGQHDVKIDFGRPQETLPGGRLNDCAAVNEVRIPRRSLRVYEDESGPTYNVYVGNAWEQDRSTWWSRPNARLNNEPRLCVRYSGDGRFRNRRSGSLSWDKDGREYGPEGDEPTLFSMAEVMEEFRVYLNDVVLPAIEAFPVADTLEEFPEPPPIPMPVGVGSFLAHASYGDTRRIELGKKCVEDLPLADHYGMNGSGWRLAPLGIKRGDDLPEVAFDGFLWCGTTPRIHNDYIGYSSHDHLVKITPKDARGIYVADHAVYARRRAELAESIKGQRDRFTDAEVNDFVRARACTIVPITEYRGDYGEPVYLINRELGFDEVEVIGKRPTSDHTKGQPKR